MQITSYGAAEGVTGSCHLLEVGDRRVLLDCGMFQGGRTNRERNEEDFPFDPSKLDALVVSHGHLDHIGRIPLLYKRGFRGRIISTRPTFELARLSLMDSAGLMASDAERRNRRLDPGEEKFEPIYDEEDVFDALELWSTYAPYHRDFEVVDGVRCELYDAGHILGSAFLSMQLQEGGDTVRFAFSGDLGNVDKPIIHDPETAPTVDVAMMETTYGDRDHKPFRESIRELEWAVNDTMKRGGNVIIPTFALERAQELLYVLFEAWRDGRIPEDVQIFLDSPMAISATRIFERHPTLFDAEALKMRSKGEDPFDFPALHYTRDTRQSIAINAVKRGAIILAGSGMVTGGRVLHHLRQNLAREECSVVFCGFQANGTIGRRIVDGAPFVRLHGQTVPCNAQVHTINGFSAHAGKEELTDWAHSTGAKKLLLVHGEPDVKVDFRRHLLDQTSAREVDVMQFAQSVDLIAASKL